MYTDKFELAFKEALYWEGGYVNHPNDPGGQTKWGISQKSYPNLDIKNLTIEQAKQIYYCDFWQKVPFEKIISDEISTKLFSICVNMGNLAGVRCVQRALRAVGNAVKDDGILGNITLNAINSAKSDVLLAALKSEAAGYYRVLNARNPKFGVFIEGWLNRAYK